MKLKILYILLLIMPIQISTAQQVDVINQKQELLNSLTKKEKAFLKSHSVIKVASQTAWPPFDYVENGIPKGYCIGYFNLIADKLDLKIKFISNYKWANLYELFKEKKIEVMPILYKNKKREKYTLYTEPYFRSTLSIYSLDNNTKINSIKDFKKEVKVGIHQADASIPYIKKKFPNIKLIELSGSKEIIRALASRKVDAIIENSIIFRYDIKKYQVYNLKLIDFVEPENSNLNPSLYIGVRKDLPILYSLIQKAMHSISEEEKSNLYEEWIKNLTYICKDISLTKEEKAYLKKKKSIKMCVDPNWMPFEQIDKNGKLRGISAEIIPMISEIINTPIELIPTNTWSQSLQNLKNKKCDIMPMVVYSKARNEYLNFTRPYISQALVVVTKEDKFFINESSELKNRKIGVVEGYIFSDLLKQKSPNINIIAVKSAKEGLRMVQEGRLFGFVDVLPTIAYTIQNNGMLNLKVAGRLEFDIPICIASRKDEPILSSIMQKALEHIKKEKIKQIVGKWVTIKVEQAFDYKKLIYITLFFSSILLVILYKNRSIKKVNKKLELAYREKDKFFSIIAHDLKGPIGNISTIFNTFELDQIKGELYYHLRTSAKNTYDLLLELLTWSRAQKGELETNPTDFDINNVLKKSVSSLELSAMKKDIQLILQNENKAIYVYADIMSITTVIRNLVANAIKFTKADGTVSLQAEQVNNTIKISIIDTGIGMPEESVSTVFALGKNISTPGTMGERGTGLGLLLCKEFVDLNKGKIGVESQLGKGTTFWFTLPIGKAINNENLIDVFKEKQLETLIIEDNFLNLHNTINELKKAGIRFKIADNGIDGIKKALEKEYDFILLDIDLPKKNGIEVNKEIRKKYPSALIIALTSYSRSEVQDMNSSVFFNDYLKKPLKIEELVIMLEKLSKAIKTPQNNV